MTYFDNIEAVLFDMDGTLIEHTWQLNQITDALFAAFEDKLAPLKSTEFFEVFWAKNADMWYMMVDGIIDGDTAQCYSYINTLRGLKKDTSLAPQMVDVWSNLVLQEAVPFADTADVLEKVGTRYKTGIVTNGFISLQRAKLERYQLDKAVSFSLVSEEAGYHKPDSRIFAEAVNRTGATSADRVLFIGDTLTADIEGALQAGLKPVFMNPKDDLTPPEGVPKIQALSELLPLLSV